MYLNLWTRALPCVALLLFAVNLPAATLIDFNDPTLFQTPTNVQPSGSNFFYNGDPGAGLSNAQRTNSDGWGYDGVQFGNNFTAASFDGGVTTTTFWDGFSFSNVNDTTTPGFGNQYAAITGSGVGGAGNYALGFGNGSAFTLPDGQRAESISVTNTTYAFLYLRDGLSPPFNPVTPIGGASGNDPGFFQVTFRGFGGANGQGGVTGETTVLLADYRSPDPAGDFILDTWQQVDLTGLGNARSIGLVFDGSDQDPVFGLNTPAYVALDNLNITAVPEPSSFLALAGLAGWFGRKRLRRLVPQRS